jgi:hypothetical protein
MFFVSNLLSSSQAGRRGFEPRLPLQNPSFSVTYSPRFCCTKSQTTQDYNGCSWVAWIGSVGVFSPSGG